MFLMISGGHIGTPTWRLHRKLYKGAWNVWPNTLETVGHKDQRLGREIVYILVFYNISFSWLLPLDGFQFIFFVAWQWKRSIEKPNWTIHRVRTLFWTKNSRTFQGPILFFKDQYEKEPWVHVFSSSSPTWAIVSWRSFCVCSFRHLRIWFGLN